MGPAMADETLGFSPGELLGSVAILGHLFQMYWPERVGHSWLFVFFAQQQSDPSLFGMPAEYVPLGPQPIRG